METIIRDYNKALEEVEKALELYQSTGEIKYTKVDSVKIRNKFTKGEQIIKDLFFMAIGDTSDLPKIIKGVQIDNTVYILHDDITHYNVSDSTCEWHWTYEDRQYRFIYNSFCNQVLSSHIWENPENAAKFLKGHMTEGNPNDSYRTVRSIAIDRFERPILTYDNVFLKKDSTLAQIVTRCKDLKHITTEDQTTLLHIVHSLKDNHNLCYAYISNTDCKYLDFTYKLIDKSELKSDKYIKSDYYRVYDYKDIDEEIKLDRLEKDVCCIGLGSAGSNILEQLAKLNYFDTYTLIDFDYVETKNLRNQIYDRLTVGDSKVSAMNSLIKHSSSKLYYIFNVHKKYEEYEWYAYKFEYLISGLDSIDARIGVLNRIKSGEIETHYLIDARYIDLESSLYFVDTSNEDEMKYYEKLLLEDKEELDKLKAKEEYKDKIYTWTPDQARDSKQFKEAVGGRCRYVAQELGINRANGNRNICHCYGDHSCACGENDCSKYIARALEEAKIENKDALNSCIHENIIHIYKLTSAWVTSAIRSIQTDNKKYFTHVEITAEPIPNAIVLKK